MSKTLRTIAAAAGLIAAILPQMAGAVVIHPTITFEDTLATYATSAYGNTTFVGFGTSGVTTDTDTDPGHSLSMALVETCGFPNNCPGGGISALVANHFFGDGVGGNIDIAFNVWSLAGMDYTVRDANGNILASATISRGGWKPVTIDFSGEAASISFGGIFEADSYLVDDLSFWTNDAVVTPPNGTPEPASLALVALALAGVASTARRRKT